tara:strand:- start:966 stop:2948 length:1983 start_codon:yes stop_codon:yes gene_type:complete
LSIFEFRKLIFTNLFLFHLTNFSFPVESSSTYKHFLKTESLNLNYLANSSSQGKSSRDKKIDDNLDLTKKLVSDGNSNQKFQLEIKSEKQYQQDSVLFAEGNVIASYKGNTLKADALVYDKSKEIVKAEGNVILVLGDQIFSADKINFDFKNKQGSFIKVNGLIKTKNLLENLDFTSYDSDRLSSIVQKIKKISVLHTPKGVNNWIFYTDELKVKNDQWFANKGIFTNDLLDSDQIKFVINNLKIIPNKDSLEIKSSINFLVLEDKFSIPFWFGNRTIRDSEDGYLFGLKPKWYLGFDNLEKDGYFIGRRLDPIKVFEDFKLNLEPQFLIQRSIQGYTNSFIGDKESVTSDKVKRNTFLSDYFALDSELLGKLNKWDLKISKKLNSFDSGKFLDASRLKFDISKEIDFLNSKWVKSLYGVYRDRIWNGSIGEAEVYLGYGSKLEKTNTWETNGITKTERLKLGLGNFKGEELNSENLVNSLRGSLFYSFDQKFPVKIQESKNKFVDSSFEYIFEPVKQGIYIDTKLAVLYSFYDRGNHQEYIEFGVGPEFVFGEFKKKYFDYTRINLFPSYKLKSGDSIFKFDQTSDQFTLDLAFDQQLYGPILLKTNGTLNLDKNSGDYGDFISSKISINLKKRSYELGIFYQPNNQSGGISFSLYGFE